MLAGKYPQFLIHLLLSGESMLCVTILEQLVDRSGDFADFPHLSVPHRLELRYQPAGGGV